MLSPPFNFLTKLEKLLLNLSLPTGVGIFTPISYSPSHARFLYQLHALRCPRLSQRKEDRRAPRHKNEVWRNCRADAAVLGKRRVCLETITFIFIFFSSTFLVFCQRTSWESSYCAKQPSEKSIYTKHEWNKKMIPE